MVASPADLSYFVETAHTLNLSRAAERLGISQPSLSLAIRRLEAEIGAELLIRSKKGVSLTRPGMQLLAQAKLLLQSWDDVRGKALASTTEIAGGYILGCHSSVAQYSLPVFLPRLMTENPNLDITLRHDLSRKIAEDVISAKIDIGIVVNPVRHPDLVIHALCRDMVTIWMGTKSRAESSRDRRAILVYDPELRQSQVILKRLEKTALQFGRSITSSNLEVIGDLVNSGCGYGILPAQAALRPPRKLRAVARMPVLYDDHCLIYRVENKNVRSIQIITKAIRDFFKVA